MQQAIDTTLGAHRSSCPRVEPLQQSFSGIPWALSCLQGVVFYAINVAVGLSVAVPGFANQIAHGLLGELPFGAISLVGGGVGGPAPRRWRV